MAKPPTMRDVAKQAGVSQRTVSNVVNNYPHVSEKMRSRVQKAIEELGYTPNVAAQRLRQGRTGIIALAIPNLSWPYFGEIAHQIQVQTHKNGFTLLVLETEADRDNEIRVLESFKRNLVDGVILSPTVISKEDLDSVNLKCPIVLLGETITDAQYLHFEIDNYTAAAEVAQHLYSREARSFLILGDSTSRVCAGPGTPRVKGFTERLAQLGLDDSSWHQIEVSPWTYQGAYSAMFKWLHHNPLPDAIFSMNDIMASGALRALGDVKASVPDDVLVCGWDGTDLAKYFLPSITSITPNKELLAQRAVGGLLELIDGGKVALGDHFVDYELVVRESSIR